MKGMKVRKLLFCRKIDILKKIVMIDNDGEKYL